MNKDWVADHRGQVEYELLSGVYEVDVDCVQTALCTGTAREEKSVDVAHAANAINYDRKQECHANHIEVVYGDEVELPLCEQFWKLAIQENANFVP